MQSIHEEPDHNGHRDADNQHLPLRRHQTPLRIIYLRLGLCALLAGTLGYVVLRPVHFPSIVHTYATVLPAQKWVLVKATDGQLIGSIFNFKSGMNEGYRVSTFNPGSSIYFSMHSTLAPGRMVAMGDTIGSIYSTEVQERLIALQGQLAAARSLLAVTASGQKSAVVNEAQQRLEFARRRSVEHQRIEARTQKLFDEHLIAAGEYDRVQSEANALRDEIIIAEANLEAARTGAKPEQLDLVNANIGALQSEIAAVKRRANTYTVTAPISGVVSPTFSGDTLVSIAAREYIALVPIKASDYRRVLATPLPRLRIVSLARIPVYGTIIALSREIQVLNGHEVAIATATLDDPSGSLMSGMLVQGQIDCMPVTAIDYGREALLALKTSRALQGGF